MTGSANADVLCGLGGDDVLRGLGGDDTIHGGSGNDAVAYDRATGGVVVNVNF